MKITEKLIPINNYNRPGTKSTPKRICVHYTGDIGASAENLAAFWRNVAKGVFKSNPTSWTSAQYVVGLDGEIIRIVPDNEIAYAASGQNNSTIHIEVCYKQESGCFEEKTIVALGELVRKLMSDYNIPAEKVLRHYDLTGKLCPAYYVDNARWAALHEKITTEPKQTLFRLQLGAFSSRKNADAYLEKVNAVLTAAGLGKAVIVADCTTQAN